MTVLHGRDHHTAAVKATLHRGAYTDVFIFLGDPVAGDGCVAAPVSKQPKLYYDGGVIDFFVGLFGTDVVGHLTGHAVNAKADAVDKAEAFVLYGDQRKIFYVIVYLHGAVNDLFFYVVAKIVTRARRAKDNGRKLQPVNGVGKPLKGPVPPDEINFIFLGVKADAKVAGGAFVVGRNVKFFHLTGLLKKFADLFFSPKVV